MPSRNATRLHKRHRIPPNLWEPKPNGTSSFVGAERYFREGMLALPYGGYRKFNGACGSIFAMAVLFQWSLMC